MNDLDTFRQQWRQELSERQQQQHPGSQQADSLNRPEPRNSALEPGALAGDNNIATPAIPKTANTRSSNVSIVEDVEFLNAHPFLQPESHGRLLDPSEQAALDLFEKAVEREHVGKMSDAVSLYRDAFKIDDKVDRLYREKYFVDSYNKKDLASVKKKESISATASFSGFSASSLASGSKLQAKKTPTAPVSTKNPQHSTMSKVVDPLDGGKIADSDLVILPENENIACPLVKAPLEIIEYVLCMVAMDDLSSFTTALRTCKLFHHLGTNTNYIWKTLSMCEFPYQSYTQDAINDYNGFVPASDDEDDSTYHSEDYDAGRRRSRVQPTKVDDSFVVEQAPYHGSWRQMYLERPRLRFDGIYISTCNYMRPGIGQSWYAPILMVTYYRYLRFFHNGTCLSLLSTDEPKDIVPVFIKQSAGVKPRDNYSVQRPDGTLISRPKGIVNGIWHLENRQGDVLIETEGSVDRYNFYLHLNVRSSGVKKQNKLKWKDFWSVNKLTQDRAEFSLKNDKAYFFAKYKY
jgi:F-box protein 9